MWRFLSISAVGLTCLSGCVSGGAEQVASSRSGIIVAPGRSGLENNGLPFGTIGQTPADLENVTIAATASVVADAGDQTEASTNTTSIRFGTGFFSQNATGQDAVVQAFGEEITVTGGEGTLSNGQTVRIFFDPDAMGDYAGTAQIVTYGALENPLPLDPINGESHVLFGFLTDPEIVEKRVAGNVEFVSDLAAFGQVSVNGTPAEVTGGVEFDGAIEVQVNFGSNWMSAQLQGTFQADDQTIGVALEMDPTAFRGNTFGGDFRCANGAGCTTNTSLDGGFYGPNAEELGGVVSLNTQHAVGATTYGFQGSGSFVATPDIR